MAEANIMKFDRMTGAIFGFLYKSFPLKVDLVDSKFSGMLVLDEEEDLIDQVINANEFFHATLDWLEFSGYIASLGWADNDSRLSGCVLTAKGLEALKATPKQLGGATIGSKILEATAAGTKKVVGDLSSQAIGVAVGLLVNQIR